MARGLFELRRDEVTGWWVAVLVDREFDRDRFRKPAIRLNQDPSHCPNCQATGDSTSVRTLKPMAFVVAGTEREAREQGQAERDPELGMVGDAGSWQTIMAPAGHHVSFAETPPQIAF